MTTAKPLFIALAIALGASAPALADEEHHNRTATTPYVAAPDAVTSSSGAPVVSGTVTTPADRTISNEDARERAGATAEEEHGGTRHRAKAKKERTREKLGMRPDD